jgi:hypothetical protein
MANETGSWVKALKAKATTRWPHWQPGLLRIY